MISFIQYIQEVRITGTMGERRYIETHLRQNGWMKDRDRGGHAIYKHPDAPEERVELPHHNKVSPGVVRDILKKTSRVAALSIN